ncbi:MAG: nucleoside 2-deoxyribosyltransferase [Candidatus Paceibacterota bacterium]|jgi:hypothetical protein
MKIYFAGSIRGGRENKEIYSEIIDTLKKYGEVLTEHIGDQSLTHLGEVNVPDGHVYKRDMDWLKSSDVLVADVSTPSLGVGYEIASAEILGKKILCLYRQGSEKKLSGMINGNKNLTIRTYNTVKDLPEIFKNFFV